MNNKGHYKKHRRSYPGGQNGRHRQGRGHGGARHSAAEHQARVAGKLEKVAVEGFKSLKKIDMRLNSVNIFIGANGSGKSNALGFFEMLSYMMSGSLREYVRRKGGGDDLLFNGAKRTQSIWADLSFGSKTGHSDYRFRLSYTEDDALAFGEERYRFTPSGKPPYEWNNLGIGHEEAAIIAPEHHISAHITKRMMQNCSVYQFHDTSPESRLKVGWDAEDVHYLKNHGGNLPSVLLDLQHNCSDNYGEIVRFMRRMLPIFKDFELKVLYGKASLRWMPQGDADKSFGAHLTSDGTLRLMALTTLLCMPAERQPDIILLDEPELGLHPEAITLVAAMIKRVAVNKQVIIATQSPLLLNEFSIDDIVVAEMGDDGGTEFKRLAEKDFINWLDEFKAGDLWQKNLLGGNP